jgi:hypothetical protein
MKRLIALAALAFSLSTAAGAGAAAPGKMGPMRGVVHPSLLAYYDGHKDRYFNLDVSNAAQARAMHINYAPGLAKIPIGSLPPLYAVVGRSAPGQLAVFGSEPGEKDYTPIWSEVDITWKADATPVLLVSDTQIDELEKQGMLTEHVNGIRLNCPIIHVGKGGS